jgi:hypothetical protein
MPNRSGSSRSSGRGLGPESWIRRRGDGWPWTGRCEAIRRARNIRAWPFARLLRHCLGDTPPDSLPSWEAALGQEQFLHFEANLPSPAGYNDQLRHHLDEHVLVPYLREAAEQSRQCGRKLEGATNVDALLTAPDFPVNDGLGIQPEPRRGRQPAVYSLHLPGGAESVNNAGPAGSAQREEPQARCRARSYRGEPPACSTATTTKIVEPASKASP